MSLETIENSDLIAECVIAPEITAFATPHNGIDLRIVRNVPGWATFGDVNNFNRKRMADYLAVPHDAAALAEDIDVSVVTNFPPDRIFNLIGSNPSDYLVMRGISAWAAGEVSDGLVRIENAATHGRDSSRSVRSPLPSTWPYSFRTTK